MAPPTTSTKLGLLVDPDGESDIATNNANWDKVDLVAGAQHINAGQAYPASFGGAIIAEKDTGISYILVSDGAGGWNKKYITYPYHYQANEGTLPVGTTGGSYATWGWSVIDTAACVNHKAADKEPGTNGWIVPVAGLWKISAWYRWNEGTNDVMRASLFQLNGSDAAYTERRKATTGASFFSYTISVLRNFAVGDTVRGRIINSGATLNMRTNFSASLVRPT